MAAAAGVDDVQLIVALALHRRMTEAELRHALGDRVYDAFAPHGLLTQHDAEDPDALLYLGQTEQGEDVEINKRAATSRPDRLREHQPGGHGRRPQERRHRAGLVQEPSPSPQRSDHAAQQIVHGPAPSELHSSNWRMGRAHRDSGIKIFQIETTLNNDTFPDQFSFLQKREWEWSARGPGRLRRRQQVVGAHATAHRSQHLPLHQGAARNDVGAGRRGRGRARRSRPNTCTASSWSRSRARPTSSRWACPTSARTT